MVKKSPSHLLQVLPRLLRYPHDVALSLQWPQSAGMLPEGPAPVAEGYIAYEEYEPFVYITQYILQA
jgi:hypothetical protein